MPQHSRPLPEFDNPPVVETVLSVQFDPLLSLKTAHLGLLWSDYKASFPKTEGRPPLDVVGEQFPEAPVGRVGLRVQTLENPPVPRLWFINERGNEMIQAQNGRFVKNWRKEGDGEQYPRYEKTIRPQFDRDYKIFLEFLKRHQLGEPTINQCEITYVNHILAGDGWEHYSDFDKVFSFWRSANMTPPGPAEDLRMHVRFLIPDQGGKPIGRLHVHLQPAVTTSDNHPMYVMELTARGQVGQSLDFFDIGRQWIVQSFKRLTSDAMHQVWRIKG
jgi:uncharacterized protein (TIGR04255 family)